MHGPDARPSRSCRRWGPALLVGLLSLPPGWAQEPLAGPGGRLEGRVLSEGRGVTGVAVVISGLGRAEVTDGEGRFVFTDVLPGVYTLQLTLGEHSAVWENVGILPFQTHGIEIEVDWRVGLQEKVTVTAGAARAAKIVDAPAAVTSIPEEQIEREASTGQVPKILEFTPGAEVTQSGLYDFNFNTRGFNSSLNRRVSTYIDGRDVSVVLLGAQEWSAISGGLDDLESLEFVRGPSAALYGANASSGVINITTKAPRESMGTMVRLTGGELDTRTIDFRHAGSLGGAWFWKVLGGAKATGDFTLSRDPDGPDRLPNTADDLEAPEYSSFCRNPGESDCLLPEKPLFRDDNDIYFGAVRLDRHLSERSLVTFEGGTSNIKGPVFQTGIGRVQNLESERPYFRFAWSNPAWNVFGHYSARRGDQVNLNKRLFANYALVSDEKRYGVESQGHWDFLGDKMRWVIGAAASWEEVDSNCNITEAWATDLVVNQLEPLPCQPGEQTILHEQIDNRRQAVFTQLDYQIATPVKLVFAGRVDWNDLHPAQVSPKIAIVGSVNPQHSIRATFNEAFQVANYSEFFLDTRIAWFAVSAFVAQICEMPRPGAPRGIDCGISSADEHGNPTFLPIIAVGQDDLELETTRQWEIGYSALLFHRAFLTVDYYNGRNENFITDLIPQIGTSLGRCLPGDPIQDPTMCLVNNDFEPWVSTAEAENFILGFPFPPGFSAADQLRAAVSQSLNPLGFRLGQRVGEPIDPATGGVEPVIVGRTYTNVGEVETQGVDFGFQYFVTDAWSVQTSYSWFDFEIVNDASLKGGPPSSTALNVEDLLLPNSPEHKASLSLAYHKNRITGSVSGRWVDSFRWAAGIFQGEVPDYTTGDLAFSYALNDLLTLGVNVANVADHEHYQAFGGDLLYRRALGYLTMTWNGGPGAP